jgi:LmbE family N-acetylglucosaminyl deacetylase
MHSGFRRALVAASLLVVCGPAGWAQHQTILAIGAHAADMDLTAGALLAHQKKLGDRVVLLHMTLGEAGNPNLSPQQYAVQKRHEAEAAAKDLGAEVIIGPYPDAMLPNNEEARRYVADVIRQVKPTYVITHWKNSFHKDHRNTHLIVVDAVLMAGLEAVKTAHPPYGGVRQIYYAENWEDDEGFQPYVYVDTSDVFEQWKKAVREYQMVRGGVSPFHYFNFYTSLEQMRGALIGKKCAVAMDVDDSAKRVALDSLK